MCRQELDEGAHFVRTLVLIFSLGFGVAFAGQAARGQDEESAAKTIQPPAASAEEEGPEAAKERIAAERFLDLLKKRPRLGTALDKVYGYHVARGSLDEFTASLQKEAEAKNDGNLWLVLGMVQMQRGHDALAAASLEKAETALPKEPLASYYLGKTLLMVGEVDRAAEAYRRAIDRKPARADLLAIFQDLGRIYQRTGRNKEALEVWQQLEKQFPGDLQVREQIAAILAEEGATAAALERYSALAGSVKDRFRKVELAVRAAQLKAQLGNTKEALADFEKQLAQVNPESWLHRDIRRRIEEVFWSSGDIDGLVAYYTDWVKRYPDDVDAMMRTARMLAAQRRVPEAEQWFRDAIKKSPTTPEPRLALVESLAGDGRYAEAAKEMGQLVELQPDNPDYIVRWGELIFADDKRPQEERRREAAEVWRRMLAKRGDDPVTVSRVADLLRSSGNTDVAIEQYQAAIKLAPNEPQYREYLGEFLHQLGRKDEALAAWRELASGERETRDNLVRLSEVLSTFHFEAEALETIAKACEMKPTFGHRARYAELLRDAKRYEDSLKQLALAEPLAEDPELRELVMSERIKNYQAAGELEKRIEEAQAAVEGDKAADPAARKLLALLYDADRKFELACDAIDKATELAPNDVSIWEAAATLQERAGRFGDAIDSYRKLSALDRRYLSSYLTQIASLEMRLGNVEAALESGEQLIASAPGNSEHYRFFADLCFRTGNGTRGLEVLRRNVRGNPNDPEAVSYLARMLSEEFETDEAIELYWRAFELGKDIDERSTVIAPLTELYLRTNRFDALVERLQTIGREQNKPRDAALWAAAAHQAAGDLGMAKQLLEGLARDDTRDTKLFEQLVALSRAEFDFQTAVEYQRRLVAAAPTPEAEYLLGNLLLELGEIDEAEAMWLKLSQRGNDRKALDASIGTLINKEQYETAAKVIERAMASDPSNWELLGPAMIAYVKLKRNDDARRIAERVLAMNVEPGEPTAETREAIKKQQARGGKQLNQYDPYEYLGQPTRMQQVVPQLKAVLTGNVDRMQYGTNALRAQCFQDVYLLASLVPLLTGGDKFDSTKFVSEFVDAALKSRDVRQLWQAVSYLIWEDQRVAYSQTPSEQYQKCLDALVEREEPYAATLQMQKIVNERNTAARADTGQAEPLDKETVEKVKRLSGVAARVSKRGNPNYYDIWLAGELARAGEQEEADKLIDRYVEQAKGSSWGSMAALQAAAVLLSGNFGGEPSDKTIDRATELLRSSIKELGSNVSQAGQLRGNLGGQLASLTNALVERNRVDDAIALIDEVLKVQAVQLSQLRPSQRQRTQNSQNSLNYNVQVNRQYMQRSVMFPPVTPAFGADAILTLHGVYSAVKDDEAKLAKLTKQLKSWAGEKTEDPNLHAARILAKASVHYWLEDRVATEKTLAAAEELKVDPQDIALMRSRLLYEAGNVEGALKLIEALKPTNQQMMVDRELTILQLVLQQGDLERAKASAQRLFALRLDANTEFKLADLMYQLGMRELGERMMGRIRRRAGGQQNTLNQLMNRYVEAGDNKAAAEIARQIVRRTTPRGSSNHYTSENVQHEQAVQVLARAGELDELIKQYEGLVERSPKSTKLIDQLCAFYDAAGRRGDADKLRIKSAENVPDDPRALYAAGQQLARLQKHKDAAEKYIAAVVKSPELLNNNYYDMRDTFTSAKAWGQLADKITESGIKKFTQSYRLSELCNELGQQNESDALNRLLYAAISELSWNELTQMMYSLGSLKFKPEPKLVALVAEKLTDPKANFDQFSNNAFVWSRSQDGRTSGTINGITSIVMSDPQLVQKVSAAMQARVEKSKDELFPRALLCMLLGKQEKFDEMETMLQPILEKKNKQHQDAQAVWSLASMLAHEAKQPERAAKILEATGAEVFKINESSDFQYTAMSLLAYSYEQANRPSDAHRILIEELKKISPQDDRYVNNPGYAEYRYLSSLTGLAERFLKMGYPAEAFIAHRKAFADESIVQRASQWGGSHYAQQKDTLAKQIASRKNTGAMVKIITSALNQEGPNGADAAEQPEVKDESIATVGQFLSEPIVARNSLLDTRISMPLEEFIEGVAKEDGLKKEIAGKLKEISLPEDAASLPLKHLVTRQLVSDAVGETAEAEAASKAIIAWAASHAPPEPKEPDKAPPAEVKEKPADATQQAGSAVPAKKEPKVINDELLLAMAALRMPEKAIDQQDVVKLLDRAIAAAQAEKEAALVSSLRCQVARRVAASEPERARKMLQEALDELLPPAKQQASLGPAQEKN